MADFTVKRSAAKNQQFTELDIHLLILVESEATWAR